MVLLPLWRAQIIWWWYEMVIRAGKPPLETIWPEAKLLVSHLQSADQEFQLVVGISHTHTQLCKGGPPNINHLCDKVGNLLITYTKSKDHLAGG